MAAPQRNTQLDTSEETLTEALHDGIVLLHEHPSLQFKLSRGTAENLEVSIPITKISSKIRFLDIIFYHLHFD